MLNQFRLYIHLILLFSSGSILAGEGLHKRYITQALKGQLGPISQELLSPSENISDGDTALVRKFQERFGPHRTIDTANTRWPFVNDIVYTYREYWSDMLLADFTPEEQESIIVARLDSVIDKHRVTPPDSLSTLEAVAYEFRKRGVQALTGKTLPHFDLLAWTGNEAKDYHVELTDGPVDVRVYFVSDFVSYGWSHYATFGVAYPGGWAESDALYCIADDYDLSSEKFKISYLKHEGRHFADYKLFPKLQSTDLEFRAKLTELIYAEETLFTLLQRFISHASQNAESPHAAANYELVQQMSQKIFNSEFESDDEKWQSVTAAVIHETASTLLIEHTRNLMAAGPDTVEGIIAP